MGCSSCQENNNIQKGTILDVLNYHNNKRELHNAQYLKNNEDLNKLAKLCAQSIAKGKEFTGNVYEGKFLGENIYIFKGRNFDVEDMCEDWYSENKNYDKNLNKYQKDTSHFTQMIWKRTTDFGFGFHKNKKYFYAVAYYYPPGNILGEYKENVLFK